MLCLQNKDLLREAVSLCPHSDNQESRKMYSLVKVSGMIVKLVMFILFSLTQTEKVADKDRRSFISTVVSQP